MNGYINTWARQCGACQTSKVSRYTQPPLIEIHVPSRQFTELNVDIVRLLPPSQGFRYLLMVMDHNTCWIEVAELQDINSTTVIQQFLWVWISSRYRCLVPIVTNRGTKFTGEL